MRLKRHLAMRAGVATVCLLVIGTAGVAGAHETGFPTQAKLHSGGPTGAEGDVSSRNPSCLGNRLVSLWRVQDGPDQNFGTDRTDRMGDFRIDASLIKGDYYAKVRPKMLVNSDLHRHICRRAVSLRVHF